MTISTIVMKPGTSSAGHAECVGCTGEQAYSGDGVALRVTFVCAKAGGYGSGVGVWLVPAAFEINCPPPVLPTTAG